MYSCGRTLWSLLGLEKKTDRFFFFLYLEYFDQVAMVEVCALVLVILVTI